MRLSKKIFKKIFNKFAFKYWKVYVFKKDIIDFLIKNPIFKESEIKKFILFTIESPNRSHLIAADPFIHDEKTILYESISKKTGNGNIFKYDIVKNKNSLIYLPDNQHYSFPRTLKINDKFLFTCESCDYKGLSIFKTDKELHFLKDVKKSIYSEDLNFHIIDPIIFFIASKIKLYCTSLEYGNNLLLYFESRYCDFLDFKLIKKIKISTSLKKDSTLRLAGLLSLKNNEYVATQNNGESYGSSLNLLKLNSNDLKETNIINDFNILRSIDCKDFVGPHTINKSKESSLVVIDLATLSWFNVSIKLKLFFSKYLKKLFNIFI